MCPPAVRMAARPQNPKVLPRLAACALIVQAALPDTVRKDRVFLNLAFIQLLASAGSEIQKARLWIPLPVAVNVAVAAARVDQVQERPRADRCRLDGLRAVPVTSRACPCHCPWACDPVSSFRARVVVVCHAECSTCHGFFFFFQSTFASLSHFLPLPSCLELSHVYTFFALFISCPCRLRLSQTAGTALQMFTCTFTNITETPPPGAASARNTQQVSLNHYFVKQS